MFQFQVEPVGIHDLDVEPGVAEGSGTLEDGQGGINGTDITVLVAFLTDDRKVFHPGGIDE